MTKKKELTDYPDWDKVIKMKALGFSQHKIAKEVGITRQSVQRILTKAVRERRKPTPQEEFNRAFPAVPKHEKPRPRGMMARLKCWIMGN